jgi:hypothetical protein
MRKVILVGIVGKQSFCKKKVAEDQEAAGDVKKDWGGLGRPAGGKQVKETSRSRAR